MQDKRLTSLCRRVYPKGHVVVSLTISKVLAVYLAQNPSLPLQL